MKHPRILIVEDEKPIAHIMSTLLSKDGYRCTITASGEEAVAIALETAPDLILMDIRLNGSVDGITACEQIYRSSRIPVLFVSAYTASSTIARAMQYSQWGYIEKPFTCSQLLGEVERVLKDPREGSA